MINKDNSRYLWYTRNKHGTKGPFTIGMVQRFILIGRLSMDDEVSTDKRVWKTIKTEPVVIPDEMRHVHTEDDHERLLQAQLREDERSKDRRREKLGEFQGRRNKTDRRQSEAVVTRAHREVRNHVQEDVDPSPRNIIPGLFSVGLVVGLIFLGIYIYLEQEKTPVQVSNCNAVPEPGVNWNHCQLEGIQLSGKDLRAAKLNNTILTGANLGDTQLSKADLAYANMSIASLVGADLVESILKGANLRGANLSNVNFTNADLSYADLSGAYIEGADFSNAILYRTIWVDGRQCLPGSVGECKN